MTRFEKKNKLNREGTNEKVPNSLFIVSPELLLISLELFIVSPELLLVSLELLLVSPNHSFARAFHSFTQACHA